MSENTRIEWCHHTFNPWSGCTKISAGCAHCYAAALPPRMRRGAEWGPDAPRVVASDAYWRQPERWNRAAEKAGERRRVFCASTADVFEDRADLDPARDRLFELIERTPHLDWLLLTKRAHVLPRYSAHFAHCPNAWVGVSVEDQRAADERIPDLLSVPATVRFLSCEPLIRPVDLTRVRVLGRMLIDALNGLGPANVMPRASLTCSIDWVIVGGESGPRARPMHPDWARSIRDQCVSGGVPFFFKQHGEFAEVDAEARGSDGDHVHRDPDNPADAARFIPGLSVGIAPDGRVARSLDAMKEGVPYRHLRRVGKRAAGRLLDGRTWDEMPRPPRAVTSRT